GPSPLRQAHLAARRSPRLNRARSLLHLPLQMPILLYRLRSPTRAIQKQLLRLSVRIAPHRNLLPLFSLPVPVRKQMYRRLTPPPNPVVVKIVLRKTARIHHAKMRADARHLIRRRLPAIVKPRPAKSSRKPCILVIKTPPCLRRARPARKVHVVRTHISTQRIVLIHPP